MKAPHSLRTLLLSLACSAALAAQAQVPVAPRLDIPAGDLATALDTYARQSGVQLVYRADQLKGARSVGVHGQLEPRQALDRLLRDSGFVAQPDASGAMLIVPRPKPAKPVPAPTPAKAGTAAAAATEAAADGPVNDLEVIVVTGSRIARVQLEGPAPITIITAEDIRASGFTSVPEVLQSLTQNGGETQSQQSAGGADFSPGAQQVDLRGLGPNHTLVLVNGRRIADFPLPFGGRSNFTDISSIPLGMIDRIEVLTGSASAIYGSDAISGVINFLLKKQADGTTLDYRYGWTEDGGGESHVFNLSSGFSRGAFNVLAGLEYRDQNPLWGFQREQQDSSNDAPNPSRYGYPPRNFLITDWWDDYIDPGAATCAGLSHLNEGTMHYAERRNYGNYCGSDRAVAYRTMVSERTGVNTYAALSYLFDNGSEWFADLQLGRHDVSLFHAPRSWSLMLPDGNEEGYFYNQATEQVEYWQRQFTLEEMGGLRNGMVNTAQNTFGVTTGLKGVFGADWDYEVAFSHSQYKARISWPQIVAAAANALFLGPQLGVDDDGFPIFNADPARLYTPLTRDEYDSIFAYTTYHPHSASQTLSFTLTQAELFELPGGASGFATTAEFGHQSYDLQPDPLATQYHYYSWKDSDGQGGRNRWALASELRMPVLESLNLSLAGRYDQYRFDGRAVGKPTWSTGVEWRPLESLLVRGSYGTAFRAPDLHYLFSGPGNDETSVTDFYLCDIEEPDENYDDCSYSSEGIIRSRVGSTLLDPETSTSMTAGMVWSPSRHFDVALDYFDIEMRNQVRDMSANEVMRWERDCRLGVVDANSATCVDMLARITRSSNGSIYGVHVNPINIANETTSGIDASANLRWETGIGDITLNGSYTWVREHDVQDYPDQAVVDEFAVNSGYDIPRSKASARLSWELDAWSVSIQGRRLGSLPNGWSYDQVWEDGDPGPKVEATYRYNANLQYTFTERAQVSLTVNNLLDKAPPVDATYTSYPYYDISWFDTQGRSFFLEFTWKLGGSPL
ncbi:MAG: TonB-dependent receptor [Xanthomonadales bacterium]|nr:TonB-dependent receptor [Xanthomonadales bacterium]